MNFLTQNFQLAPANYIQCPDPATWVGLRHYHNDYSTQIIKTILIQLQQLMTNSLINHKNFNDKNYLNDQD